MNYLILISLNSSLCNDLHALHNSCTHSLYCLVITLQLNMNIIKHKLSTCINEKIVYVNEIKYLYGHPHKLL